MASILVQCPNGVATTKDLTPAYAKLFPLGDSRKYAEIVFNNFDEDKDGFVSFGDLLTGLASIVKGNADQKLCWIFRLVSVFHFLLRSFHLWSLERNELRLSNFAPLMYRSLPRALCLQYLSYTYIWLSILYSLSCSNFIVPLMFSRAPFL